MSKLLSPEQKRQAEDLFRRFLRNRGIKFTRPRQAILGAVLQINEHFEAEQLMAQLWQGGEKVAKATIYRTLPLLVDCGILKQVYFSGTQAHYEHTYGEDPHDHMVCGRCGRIIEFDSSGIAELTARLAQQHGFRAVGHRFQISGLCQACVKSCPGGELP